MIILIKYLKNKLSKTNVIIIFVIIFGFFIGIFSTNTLSKLEISIENNLTKSYFEIFLNAFTTNYWYLFIIWFLGLIPFSFIISLFITFFKSFITGVTLGVFLKNSAVVGIFKFLSFSILEILIIIPLIIYLTTKSIAYSLNKFNPITLNNESYFNVLFKTTIFTIIYAILTCIRIALLEA